MGRDWAVVRGRALLYLVLLCACQGEEAAKAADGTAAQSEPKASDAKELADAAGRLRFRLKLVNSLKGLPHGAPPALEERSGAREAPHRATVLMRQKTRGIVIAAAGRNMQFNAIIHIMVMRGTMKCALPVEVAYHGEGEADNDAIAILKSMPGVTVTDTAQKPYPSYIYKSTKNWVKKVLAIYHAAFDQILFLDADSLPLMDPTAMFEWENFKQHGTFFWADFWPPGGQLSVKEQAYTSFNFDPPWVDDLGWRAIESGQFLLDRKRHADVMDWILFLNANGESMTEFMYGDKDTFELAFLLAEKHASFHRSPYWPRIACSAQREDKHYWHVGIIQNSPRGEPAFYHRRSKCCKFWLQTPVDTWELPRTITPPLSLPALQQSKDPCRDSKGNQAPCLPIDKVIVPDEVKCQHIDLGSLLLLERHNQTRWSGCRPREEMLTTHIPVPIMLLEWFPQPASDAVAAVLAAVAAIQKHLKGGDSSHFRAMLHNMPQQAA